MIKFFNHSSFLLDNILVDPWTKGSIFLNGWNLLKEFDKEISQYGYDWIYISHEHPDHFNIPFLESISDPEMKTIIFHKTLDRKVVSFVKRLGFKVLEVENNRYYELTTGRIKVQSNGFDSFFVYEHNNGKTLVNMNDYQVRDESELTKLQLKKVDVLLSQFTYANWAGNKGDVNMPKKAQSIIYDRLKMQLKVFKPETWVPFASYIYYSHEENFYMNEYVPPLTDIKRFADVNKVECVFPVPETFIHSRMSENGLQYWSTMRKIIKPLHKNNTIKKEKVIKSFSSMCEELHNKNDMTLFDAEETYIKVTDWNTVIKYDIKNKTFEEVSQLENDISMSSECLCFLIENKWGRGTVLISGRCQINYNNANKFFNQTNLWYYNNIGKYLGENLSLDEIVNQDNFYERLINDS